MKRRSEKNCIKRGHIIIFPPPEKESYPQKRRKGPRTLMYDLSTALDVISFHPP
jgi:hypothetical protein